MFCYILCVFSISVNFHFHLTAPLRSASTITCADRSISLSNTNSRVVAYIVSCKRRRQFSFGCQPCSKALQEIVCNYKPTERCMTWCFPNLRPCNQRSNFSVHSPTHVTHSHSSNHPQPSTQPHPFVHAINIKCSYKY